MWWRLPPDQVGRELRVQTAVCFTNPQIRIEPAVKEQIEREAQSDRRRWENFRLLVPADFAAWAGTLRFGMEQGRGMNFAPYRLRPEYIQSLAQDYFRSQPWSEIRNLMPAGQPFAYLLLEEQGRTMQFFPLRATEGTLGRESQRCNLVVPESYSRVSRSHARVARLGGDVWIEDLDSSRGTFIDGARIEAPQRLREGQRITLGGEASDVGACTLIFSLRLPEAMRAGATALDTGTS
ncbi:MAG TPA: FHA domain-containing protein [Herpetosiphonaceae bacterium]|nr:FHA domain-containing protein [Herpetosiphonaceae bacterium]